MIEEGRAKIEQLRLEQLAKIEINRKEALAKLNIQYAVADKVKTSFGIIGILFNIFTWGCIILNDLIKLLHLCFKETIDLLKEIKRQKAKEKKEKEIEKERTVIQMEDEAYSLELEDKLEQFHIRLVKACARRACQNQRNKNANKTYISK